MRSTLRAVALAGLLTSYASGGTVTFDPERAWTVGGGEAVYDVIVSDSTLGTFDTVSLLLGSHDGLNMTFEYAQSFVASTSLPPAPPTPFGVYTTDLIVGGNNFAGWQAPLLVGTLTIDTMGPWWGSYTFGVSTAEEIELTGTGLSGLAMGFDSEGVEGMGRLDANVPEPATLFILAIGGGLVTLSRRRHQATT